MFSYLDTSRCNFLIKWHHEFSFGRITAFIWQNDPEFVLVGESKKVYGQFIYIQPGLVYKEKSTGL